MNIAQVLTHAKQCLTDAVANHDSDDANIDARVLLRHVLQCSNTYLYTYPEKQLNSEQSKLFSNLIQRRCLGEPIAYIVGYKEFWGLKLNVSPATLIPRPETELLVEIALEKASGVETSILDLGTGTGAVALSIAREKPNWRVVGVDKVDAAIQLAKANKSHLNIANVDFFVSNWFSCVNGEKFTVIVSNPPYVEKESECLGKGDLRFEPSSALISENSGLDDIFTIIDNSPNYLASNGWLMIEHGHQQADSIAAQMKARGFKSISTRNDIQQHPRVTIGCWPQ